MGLTQERLPTLSVVGGAHYARHMSFSRAGVPSPASRLDEIEGPEESDLFAAEVVSDDVLANPLDMVIVGLTGLLLVKTDDPEHFRLDADALAVIEELVEKDVSLFALVDMDAAAYDRLRAEHPQLLVFEETVVTGEEHLAVTDEEMWEVVEEVTRHTGGLSDALYVDADPSFVMAAEQAGVDGVCVSDAATLRAELRLRGLGVSA